MVWPPPVVVAPNQGEEPLMFTPEKISGYPVVTPTDERQDYLYRWGSYGRTRVCKNTRQRLQEPPE